MCVWVFLPGNSSTPFQSCVKDFVFMWSMMIHFLLTNSLSLLSILLLCLWRSSRLNLSREWFVDTTRIGVPAVTSCCTLSLFPLPSPLHLPGPGRWIRPKENNNQFKSKGKSYPYQLAFCISLLLSGEIVEESSASIYSSSSLTSENVDQWSHRFYWLVQRHGKLNRIIN